MRNSVQEYVREQNGKRILEMKSGNKENRMDGYMNMLNKYGTTQDSSTAYTYSADGLVSDMELTDQYISNGLFAKIIDAPAEEAVKHGYDFKLNDQETEDFISDELDRLDWEETAATAIKWTRLYGGAIIVMLVDDGCDLDEPLDWDAVEEIEELRVYERAIVEPDYSSLYTYNPEKVRRHGSKFQKPEFYHVNSQFGRFKVHESRCLVFQNGKLPEKINYSAYQFFGIPEYLRLQQALQDTIVSHSDGVKLLERCIQAIYKMKNLSNLLSTAEGEEKVLKRLEVIDLARGILNSLVIDSEGEDYDFKSMPLSGVKDIIDSACNMLSAITNIPQTILFGRSPAGENSTGESDMENYYNFVNKIQKMMLKKNLRVLLDLIFECGRKNGEVAEIPAYKVGFVPLWSLSETEQANVDAVKATTEQTKAATAQVYVDMQVLDPSEVRAGLKKSEEYTINDLLNEEDDLDLAGLLGINQEEETVTEEAQNSKENVTDKQNTIDGKKDVPSPYNESIEIHKDDASTDKGVGVLVIRNGKILVGNRTDGKGLCGPGGHIEQGETPRQAAIRETIEEFNIVPLELIDLGETESMRQESGSHIFLCTKYLHKPRADDKEMKNGSFLSFENMKTNGQILFAPFAESLDLLLARLGINHDGGPGSGRKPEGGSEKDLTSNEKTANIKVSAKGANKFEIGFSKQKLNNHWQNGRTHKEEYPGFTKEQYAARALELIQKPCGNGIEGYKNKRGEVCRYDAKENDYVKGNPQKGINTMFKPKDGVEYYKRLLEVEGLEEDES